MTYIVMIGNLTEGFVPVGPYESFDEAADKHPGADTWVMSVLSPAEHLIYEKTGQRPKEQG